MQKVGFKKFEVEEIKRADGKFEGPIYGNYINGKQNTVWEGWYGDKYNTEIEGIESCGEP